MLKINNKLCQKGFSLIELMVAVVILALAIFGIFQAYSVGFMGMADARDRTEAVNYIQKTLEEYKNTTFVKIIDKPMHQITGTKFLSGSIVIEQETRLKKIITQVRWPDRNGDIKIEEASTLIYATEKTGELLDASEIVLYASPYFRILPNTSTDLFAEIQDANGNIVTNKVYTVNFFILEGDTLGYLDSATDDTNKGIASVKFYSNEDSDGSVSIKASADLDGDGTDDVSDTIVITISTGAEGIILVPAFDSSLAGTSVNVDLYVVDASFKIDGVVIEYTGTITLSATGPATLSVSSIDFDPSAAGTASFTLISNGTPGTVEIIASAPDLDLGYTEVTFTGGAESIQLTPNYGSIYEGESIEITIKILDENYNPTPFSGSITMASDGGGSFDTVDPDPFIEQSSGTVNFSYGTATVDSIEITATGDDGLTSNTIYIDVLDSLIPSYIELTADPSSVKANGDENDYSFITATVYDDSDPAEVVTNYTTAITFSISEGAGYFLDGTTQVKTISVTPSHGRAYIDLYSDSSGTAIVTATSGALILDSINITFYLSASDILLTTNLFPPYQVVANGEDYAVITATIRDANGITVTNYPDDITFSVSGVGSFSGENPITPTNGIAQINLYSDTDGTATVDAYSDDLIQSITLEADAINIEFTPPTAKNITFVEGSVVSVDHYKIIKFDIEVTGADVDLSGMGISWTANALLDKIEIMSPSSSGTYVPIINTNSASSPHTETISTILYRSENDINSSIRLTFISSNNIMREQTINVTFSDNEGDYPIQVYIPK